MYLLRIVWGASLVVSCGSLVVHTGGQVLNLFGPLILGLSALAGLNLVSSLIDDSFSKCT